MDRFWMNVVASVANGNKVGYGILPTLTSQFSMMKVKILARYSAPLAITFTSFKYGFGYGFIHWTNS
jgi:hypothetical protein